ncbi:membrane glycoprotein UL119 [Human betaherpesvirus 5]|uniref:Membrane glycoprotein UL119 n=1 Tax=Human cytomegalovirus TaxID=10359 RepID=A0A126N944_HCMV|nr:membrane glycoprotein UL119 [Human betaherpesvirus 5]APG57470.1 membrane glycoprotein UL119 [Human betaherpesvirus 5]
MCPVLAIALMVTLLGDTHPGVESSTTSAVTSPINTTVTSTTSIITSNNVTSAVSTTVQTFISTSGSTSTSAATSVAATTQKEGHLYTVNCEASYSYDQVSLNATCKVSLLNNTVNPDILSITCYARTDCKGPFTQVGYLSAFAPGDKGKLHLSYNATAQELLISGLRPQETTEYTCSFFSWGRHHNATWDLFTYPIYAVYGTRLNATTMRVRVLLQEHEHCLLNGSSLYHPNSTVHLHQGDQLIPPWNISNVTYNGQRLREFVFYLNGTYTVVRLHVQIAGRSFTTTYVFIKSDPLFEDRLLAYGVLAFLVFMVIILLYVTYMLARRRDWSYKRLEEPVEEKKHPVPYFKQW